MSRAARELGAVVTVAALLTIAFTYPLAVKMGRVGRVDTADGRFSIWNVAWVARTLVRDPLHIFDANIFFPHRGTLAYSENNLGAGALAVPAYWLTRGNPYAAHNAAMLLAFVLGASGMYYLVRYLTANRSASAIAAIGFAFCPYVFAHTAHIQLMMTAGLPFAMLAFHRLADRPTLGRGAALGMVMSAQAICCGYYGVFVALMVAFSAVVAAAWGRRWASPEYWLGIAAAAIVPLAIVTPLFLPYAALQHDFGFARSLDDARRYSANWVAYLASSSHAHEWWLRFLPAWRGEVAFPGIVTTTLGIAGARLGWRVRGGELIAIYGGLIVLACWTSFGPDAGLYTVFYRTVPVFTLLRAPGRFALLVVFGLSVLCGVALSVLLARWRRATAMALMIGVCAVAELFVTLYLVEAPPVEPVYRTLATLPRAATIELPFYYPEVGLYQHTKYMLTSTSHWMPLVNGYSDYIPPDFVANSLPLATFPSRAAFKILEPDRVRYAVFHMYGFNAANRRDVLARLDEFTAYLRPLYSDETTRLYEIVAFPP